MDAAASQTHKDTTAICGEQRTVSDTNRLQNESHADLLPPDAPTTSTPEQHVRSHENASGFDHTSTLPPNQDTAAARMSDSASSGLSRASTVEMTEEEIEQAIRAATQQTAGQGTPEDSPTAYLSTTPRQGLPHSATQHEHVEDMESEQQQNETAADIPTGEYNSSLSLVTLKRLANRCRRHV